MPYDSNLLCYGDNLQFLKDTDRFPPESVDLIYLDPPFNSQQSYNVLFKESTGEPEAAQFQAFEDTWKWSQESNQALTAIVTDASMPAPLVELMKTFMQFLKASPMMAYLVQMALRLVYLHRVLKPTGSLYLHCDPTASHYLKLILDAVFGPRNFRREVVWRSGWVSGFKTAARNWIRNHDVLLYYLKDANCDFTFNKELCYKPHDEGYSRRGGGGNPKGVALDDVWDEVALYSPWIKSFSKEKLGYMTQKPVTLLKRIVAVSSRPGDVVMDPFCGCGTTIDAVETLNRENPDEPPRRWIGIDITHLAINLIKNRLTRFMPPPVYEVVGEPASRAAAAVLARADPFQFQLWALGLIRARPMGGRAKKGADQGIDGVRFFQDEHKNGAPVTKKMLVQVKGGHAGPRDVRDLAGTVAREGAEMGVLLTLEEPTAPMKKEAAAAGTYTSPWDNRAYPKVQILTVGELLKDRQRPDPACLQMPRVAGMNVTLPEALKHKAKRVRQRGLDLGGSGSGDPPRGIAL